MRSALTNDFESSIKGFKILPADRKSSIGKMSNSDSLGELPGLQMSN
jgi:hypothetical protein